MNIPQLIINEKQVFEIYVPFIESPFKFTVQIIPEFDKFKIIEDGFQDFYELNENTDHSLLYGKNVPSVGEICMSKFKDPISLTESWYRALVKEILPNSELKVYYIDYGNEEIVNLSSIRKIRPDLYKIPAQAIQCTLNKVKEKRLNSEQKNELKDLMYNLLVDRGRCRFVTKLKDNDWLVDVKTDKNESLAKNLIDLDFVLPENGEQAPTTPSTRPESAQLGLIDKQSTQSALRSIQTTPVSAKTYQDSLKKIELTPTSKANSGVRYLPQQPLNKNDYYEATVSNVLNSFFEFNIQLIKNKNILVQLTNEINNYYGSGLSPLTSRNKGPLEVNCACIYFDTKKQAWYRVIVIAILAGDLHVIKLVDYGSTACVHRIQLKPLNERFLDIAPLAYTACIDFEGDKNVDLSMEQESEDSFKFEQLTLNKTFTVKVIDYALNNTHTEPIYKLNFYSKISIVQKMYESEFKPIRTDQTIQESPVIKQTQTPTSQSKQSLPSPFPQHDRSSIPPLPPQKLHFQNGNGSKQIPHQKRVTPIESDSDIWTKQLPQQQVVEAVELVPPPSPTAPQPAIHQSKVVEEQTKTPTISVTEEKPTIAEPLVESKPDADEEITKIKEPEFKRPTEPARKSIEIPIEKPFESIKHLDTYKWVTFNRRHRIRITHVIDPSYFYVQLQDEYYKLDRQFDDFQSICKRAPSLETYDIGVICAARYYVNKDNLKSPENYWYRARIEEYNENEKTATIFFVDFGNTQKTDFSDLVQLNSKFNQPIFCVRASLINANFTEWNDELKEIFETLTYNESSDNDLTIRGQTSLTNKSICNSQRDWTAFFYQGPSGSFIVQIDLLVKLCVYHNVFTLVETPNRLVDKISKFDYPDWNLDETSFAYLLNGYPYKIKCLISYIDDLNSIFFHPYAFKKQFNELNNRIKDCVANNELLRLSKIKGLTNLLGIYCLVKCRSEAMTQTSVVRGKIIQKLNENEYFVYLVDYGHKVKANFNEDLFYLWPKFKVPCCQVIQCRLPFANTIESTWNEEEKSRFFSCFNPGKQVKIKILSKNEPFLFEFIDAFKNIDYDIAPIIQRLNFSAFDNPSFNEFYANNYQMSIYSLLKYDSINNLAYLHAKRLEPVLKDFEAYLNSLPEVERLTKQSQDVILSNLKNAKTALIKSLLNDKWLRSELSIKDDTVTINYIDYGQSESMKIDDLAKSNRVAAINSHTLRYFPSFCIKISLDIDYLTHQLKTEVPLLIDTYATLGLLDITLNKKPSNDYIIEVLNNTFPFKAKLVQTEANQIDEFMVSLTETSIENVLLNNINKLKFSCSIIFINSPEDFYIQKSTDMSYIDKIQNELNSGIELPLPKQIIINDICISLFKEDQQYYRARVIDYDEKHQKAYVYFIDFGNFEEVNIDDLREFNRELKSLKEYPPMAINCKLNLSGLVKDNQAYMTNFKEFFVNETAEKQYQFELMNIEKSTLPLPSFSAHKNLEQQDAYVFTCNLIDIESNKSLENLFIVQNNLLDETAADYDHALAVDQTQASMNTTIFQEGNYTMNQTRNDIDTFLFNNTYYNADIQETNVRSAETTWCDVPNYFLVRQNNQIITVPTETLDPQNALSVKDSLQNQIDEIDGDEGGEMYSTASDNSVIFATEKLEEPKQDLKFDHKKALISFYNSYKDFYIQEPNAEEKVAEIQTKIDDCLDPLTSNNTGDLCIAQFKEDEKFYRAKILKWKTKTEGHARVVFIDYGNDDLSDINQITKMSDELKAIPPFAKQCSIDLEIADETDAKVVNDKMNELVNNETLFNIKINSVKDGLFSVKLYLADTNKPLDQNFFFRRELSTPETPPEFNLKTTQKQTSSSTTQDKRTSARLEEFRFEYPDVSVWSNVNGECIAERPIDDESTYIDTDWTVNRNQTVSYFDESIWNTHVNETTLNFGNESIWTAEKQNETTVNFGNETAWTQSGNNNTTVHFSETTWLSEKRNNTTVNFDESNWSITQRENQNQNVDESTWSINSNLSVFDAKERIKLSNNYKIQYLREFKGTVMAVSSLKSFYVQIDEADNQLMKMKSLMDKASTPLERPSAGSLCLAFDEIDDQINRAQIINVEVDKREAKILFIDYGHIASLPLNGLYRISSELRMVHALAKHCCLKDALNLSDETHLLSEFKKLTSKNQVMVKVLKDNLEGPMLVDVFIDGINVRHRMNLAADKNFVPSENKDYFTGRVLNVSSVDSFLVQKLRLLEEINKKINDYFDVNMTVLEPNEDDEICLAPWSKLIQSKQQTKFVRAKIITRNNDVNKVLITYIDYGIQEQVNKSLLIKLTGELSEIEPAVVYYKLYLPVNYSSLKTQFQTQINQLFRQLIDKSSTYKIIVSTKPNQNDKSLHVSHIDDDEYSEYLPTAAVSLIDLNLKNFDVNCIIEKSVLALSEPFVGRLSKVESDSVHFNILSVCTSTKYLVEIEKFYEKCLEEVKNNQIKPKIGYICLLNDPMKANTKTDQRLSSYPSHKQSINRVLLTNINGSNYQVLDLDTADLKVTQESCLISVQNEMWSESLPSMTLQCLIDKSEDQSFSINKLLNNSRYYGSILRLSIVEHQDKIHKKVQIFEDAQQKTIPKQTSPPNVANCEVNIKYFNTQPLFYILCYFKTLNCFFIQSSQTPYYLEVIKNQCSSEEPKSLDKIPPIDGTIYAIISKYRKQELCRARVLSYGKDNLVDVFCIDYGHLEQVNWRSNLFRIDDPVFNNIPEQAICCKLDVKSHYETSRDYCEKFCAQLVNKPFHVKFIDDTSKDKQSVIRKCSIIIENKQLNELIGLDRSHFANLSFPQIDFSLMHNVTVSAFNSFDDFIISFSDWFLEHKLVRQHAQMDYESGRLVPVQLNKDNLISRLNSFCLLRIFDKGMPSSQEPFDNKYVFRAKLLNFDEKCNSATFYLIDSGRIHLSKVDGFELYDLDSKYYQFKLTSLECRMEGIRVVDKKKIQALINDRKLSMKIIKERDSRYTVRLFDHNTNQDLAKILSDQNLATSDDQNVNSLSETRFNLNHIIDVSLVYLADSKHFGVVLNELKNKRLEFLKQLHLYHVEKKSNGKLERVKQLKIGSPCVIHSFQMSRFCRGIISFLEQEYCRVYLVDHCQTMNVEISKIYELDEKFFKDKVFAHKCQLDDSENKYKQEIENLKKEASSLNVDDSYLNRFVFKIEVVKINQTNSFDTLYTVKIIDKQNDESIIFNGSSVMGNDSTTENILCSTYRDNSYLKNHQDLSDVYSSTSNRRQPILHESETFSSITDTTIDDLNQTSKWINESSDQLNDMCLNNIQPYDQIPVRIVPNGIFPLEFYCQKLNLLKKFSLLTENMNKFYNDQQSQALRTAKVGDFCVAKIGSNWSRCQIIDLNSNVALVECIDDGKNIRLKLDQLYPLVDQFKSLPSVAFKCKLFGTQKLSKLPIQDCKIFEKIQNLVPEENLVAEILVSHFEDGRASYDINLLANNVNILDTLV